MPFIARKAFALASLAVTQTLARALHVIVAGVVKHVSGAVNHVGEQFGSTDVAVDIHDLSSEDHKESKSH